MEKLNYILIAVGCFFLGGFPTGVVLTKRKFGLDVREMGSGNIGATNVTRVFGWYAGVLVFIIDFMKGYLPLYLLHRYYSAEPWGLTLAGFFLVFGHCFSPYLKLNGGKGVATSLGALAFVVPLAAALAAGSYGILLIATRISAIGSLGGIVAILSFLVFMRPDPPISVLILSISFIVVIRHQQNIRRLIKGA